jgi:tRNA A-37 threonylcarbamoyl transferase component Bud32
VAFCSSVPTTVLSDKPMASQAAQAILFLHANGVLHGDITCGNFFFDKKLNSKIFPSLDDSVAILELPGRIVEDLKVCRLQ